jgi:hypothetical protein
MQYGGFLRVEAAPALGAGEQGGRPGPLSRQGPLVCQYVYGVGVVCWGLAVVLFHASSRKTRVFVTPAFACPR